MLLSRLKVLDALLIAAVVVILAAVARPMVKVEIERRVMLRWSDKLRERITPEPAWKNVRSYAISKGGRYAEIVGEVESDASLQRLKSEIQAVGFPYRINWHVTVATNSSVQK